MEQLAVLNSAILNSRSKSRLHDLFSRWSSPPSQTEIEKCERVERMVKEAIDSDPKLQKMSIRVFAKGSYANRTNIPSDSDVDVAVVAENYFFNDYPANKKASDYGYFDSSYTFEEFSKDVANAIIKKFGAIEVEVDSKCIKIRSNSCRVDADVVPHFNHIRFKESGSSYEGVALKANGSVIYNWPDQDYANGVTKNTETGKRYKGFVRILKTIRTEMKVGGIDSAKFAKSYLISCLIWNVPNDKFLGDNYSEIMTNILDYLIYQTSDSKNVNEWGEVNELKYLFRSAQPWKIDEVNLFLRDAKKFIGQL